MRAWENFVKNQEKELGIANSNKWLKALVIARFDARNLFLEAKDAFVREWFEQHLREKAEKELLTPSGRPIRIHLTLAKQNIISEKAVGEKSQELVFASDAIDPYAHFSNFIVSDENQMSLTLFEELSKTSSDKYNPIYLYGPKGSGKSHLLMALCKKLRQEGQRVFYVRGGTFMRHVVSAIRGGEMEKFRKVYREIDVWLFDDVGELARRKATQEEFFHTFNLLHTAGKQIVLSANMPQALLSEIEERLVSRFEWGLTLTLGKPTNKLCREIVKGHSEELCFPLTGEVLDYLVQKFSTTTALMEALNALVLRSHLGRKERICLGDAKGYLQDLCKKEISAALTSESLAHIVAEVFGIRHEDILGRSQCREFVLPRQMAMYLCREKLKMPYTKIGHTFSKDHSTVMSSVKIIEEALQKEGREIHTYLCDIERRLCKH